MVHYWYFGVLGIVGAGGGYFFLQQNKKKKTEVKPYPDVVFDDTYDDRDNFVYDSEYSDEA